MAFSKGKLIVVRDLALKVSNKAQELINSLDGETRYQRGEDGTWTNRVVWPGSRAPLHANFIMGTRATGEFRRLTMDLTRALADVRRPN